MNECKDSYFNVPCDEVDQHENVKCHDAEGFNGKCEDFHCEDKMVYAGQKEVPAEGKYPMFIDPLADNFNNPPQYLPQTEQQTFDNEHLKPLGPVGPWAGSTVDWSPMAGLTGTRPVVNRYSITRFSNNEWSQRNLNTLSKKDTAVQNTNINGLNSKTNLKQLTEHMALLQNESTEQLRKRSQFIGHKRDQLKVAIHALFDEISSLEEARLRLKKSLQILCLPESIAKECIELRSKRPENELVRDQPEEELITELALIAEIRRVLNKMLEDIVKQQSDNRKSCRRLEFDWSDKKQSYKMDTENFQTRSTSKNIMFRPGFVRLPAEQSSEECWLNFTLDALKDAEICRQRSIKLRENLNSTLLSTARDLCSQAGNVDKVLNLRISCLQQNIQRFDNELKDCLQKLTDTENRITYLQRAIRNFNPSTKVVQTRLYVRSYRPGYENCRDVSQQKLLNEHDYIQCSLSTMISELSEAENCKNELMLRRGELERELLLKRRALWIDAENCIRKRLHYPSAIALSGFVDF